MASSEVNGVFEIMKEWTEKDIFDLVDIVTKKSIKVVSREEAFKAIISFSASPEELLHRKKFSRDILMQYALNKKISIGPSASKNKIIPIILEHWNNVRILDKSDDQEKAWKDQEESLQSEIKTKEKSLTDSLASLRDQLTMEKEKIQQHKDMIKRILDKSDDQEKAWKDQEESLQSEIKTKEKSLTDSLASLRDQLTMKKEKIQQHKDMIKRILDKSDDQEKAWKDQKESLQSETERTKLKRDNGAEQELEKKFDEAKRVRKSTEQRIKELKNQLKQENVDNKLLESKI